MKNQNTYKCYFVLICFNLISLFGSVVMAQNTPVAKNGKLKVCGTQLCNQYNKPIQLRGMSTHGIQWYGWGNCLTESSLDALAYDWEADILRISLYVQEGGYETDPVGFTNQVSQLINEATARGMYALVDWHQLNPGDPNINLENAKRFFTDIATLHKDKNNIIYDVCNEPNGVGVNWNRIKNYADQIIPVIQTIDNDAVVLVGTHGWATFGVSGEGSLQDVIDNPLRFDNIMYTFHFYAKSHREAYLNTLDRASDQLPVFVTEFGSQEYTGDGPNDFAMTQRFIDLMRQKKISWTSWNYSDDFRSGAAWQTGTCSGGPWSTNRLKEAGKWIRDKIKFPADEFPGGDSGTTQTPYNGAPIVIPGIIEAENYDLGGQSVAYNDVTGSNQGGTYRNDTVDIEPCSEGGYNVGWIQSGEWLEYTIDVLETNTYTVACRVAALTSGKSFHIEVNNQNSSGPINVPNTGGWQNWQTVEVNVPLTKGKQIIRVSMDADDFNLDRLDFSSTGTSTNQQPLCSIVTPSNNQTFEKGSTLLIAANVSDPDGSISKVEFFRNDTLISTDTSMPYEYTLSSVEEGTHLLMVKAYDDKGAFTMSSPVSITVNKTDEGSCNTAQYVDGTSYSRGDKVQYDGKEYECLVAGWCTVGGPYAPGVGWAWENAWEELGLCTEGNTPPEVTVMIPTVVYADALPITVPFRVRVTDPDGIEESVYVNVSGETLLLSPQGNDEYESDWSFSEYGTFNFTGEAVDTKGLLTQFTFDITIKETIDGGDLLMTKEEFDEFFPYRYGTDLSTYEIDPAKDFFTYESFIEAIARMSTIEVTFERRKGTNLYRLTRRDKTTNQSVVIRTDADFDADWNQSKPIVTQVVDYEKFVSEGDETTIKRELAAFLANISQETTGGWATAPGGPYSWGLHFREEQGYEGTTNLGYRDEGNIDYPPAPGKSYHGRGPIQLSWNYNYGQVSEFLFGDKTILLNNPEQVVQDAALAFQTAIWFWMTPQYPKPSAHDVMVGNWIPTPYDLERNRKPGFGITVNIINGGIECGKGTEIPKVLGRIGFYERYAGILNINTDLDDTNDCSECGCATMQPFIGIEPEPEVSPVLGIIKKHETKIAISPNPFEHELRIDIESESEVQMTAKITDFMGHDLIRIPTEIIKKEEVFVIDDLSELPSGIYFLIVKIGEKEKAFKVVKR